MPVMYPYTNGSPSVIQFIIMPMKNTKVASTMDPRNAFLNLLSIDSQIAMRSSAGTCVSTYSLAYGISLFVK